METNLTNFQKGLLNDLTNEFNKLNPQRVTAVTTERFGIKTIDDCIDTERKFKDSIQSYNNKIVIKLRKDLDSMLKEFDKEYKGLLHTQCGSFSFSNKDKESFFKRILNDISNKEENSNEMYLFLVGKKDYSGNYDQCQGKENAQLYVRFRTEVQSITLKNLKQINLHKIIGLKFSRTDWLSSNPVNFNSLDELIQSDYTLQQYIVRLCE